MIRGWYNEKPVANWIEATVTAAARWGRTKPSIMQRQRGTWLLKWNIWPWQLSSIFLVWRYGKRFQSTFTSSSQGERRGSIQMVSKDNCSTASHKLVLLPTRPPPFCCRQLKVSSSSIRSRHQLYGSMYSSHFFLPTINSHTLFMYFVFVFVCYETATRTSSYSPRR